MDTAGLRRTTHPIERLAVEFSEREVQQADLVVLVLDGSEPVAAEARPVLSQLERQTAQGILVLNKSDLGRSEVGWAPRPSAPWRTLAVSAQTGDGLPALRQALLEAVAPRRDHAPGQAAVFTSRQAALLTGALAVERPDSAAAGADRSRVAGALLGRHPAGSPAGSSAY